MRERSATTILFYAVFGVLSGLAVAPLWRTHLLPMQDYPQFLVIARAFGDCHDPSSPFYGTYTTGFRFSPLLLPIVVVRAITRVASFETAGRVMWTLYAVGLPVASLYLLDALRRPRWAVLLVFPLVFSYWSVGGFFAFATAMPLLVFGLAQGIRWLELPASASSEDTWVRGLTVAMIAVWLFLWHALAFAQFLLDFGVLWLLFRAPSMRHRLRALAPLVPSLVLFAAWMASTVYGRPPAQRPATWPPFLDNAGRFFEYIGPTLPGAAGAAMLVAALVVVGAAPRSAAPSAAAAFPLFRAENPFAWLAALAGLAFIVLPAKCFGVEGIQNRQPYLAALLFVFAWTLPTGRRARVLLLGAVGLAAAFNLVQMGRRFAAFDRETIGASRLLDQIGPGETVYAPMSGARAGTESFPTNSLVALDLYGTIRHGGLPNSSFAGYDINFIRYVDDKNPMPGLRGGWLNDAALSNFTYVLVRMPADDAERSPKLRIVGRDGDFVLFAVCSAKAPHC